MGRISGKGGAIAIGSTGTMHLKQWTITWAQPAIDVTAFGDGGNKTTPGLVNFRGSARGSLDGSTAPDLPSVTVAATFTAAAGRTYVGNITVTEITPDVTIDSEASVSVSFVGDGALTVS